MTQDGDKKERDDQKDLELLEAIRNKQTNAWATFIEKYQGRLLNFAISKLHQQADAEDVIQDTFVSFIKSLDNYRGIGTLENYLFAILRNKIIDRYHSSTNSICLIQDVCCSDTNGNNADAAVEFPASSPTQSWIITQSEQRHIHQEVLAQALLKLCQNFKDNLKFNNLKILELLLYCGVSAPTAANILKMESNAVRVFKHRCLKQLRQTIESLSPSVEFSDIIFENMLRETWEAYRFTCPKRSTIGAFLLEQVEPEWFDYIDFHLTVLGCHFCRANFKDIKQKKTLEEELFRERILASTIGFLSNP